jgi:hypothetical protein
MTNFPKRTSTMRTLSAGAFIQARRRAMKRYVFGVALVSHFGLAMAQDQSVESTVDNAFNPKQSTSEPVVRIVREGRACFEETSIQKMVEACYDGKTYYTPMTEKTRVKVKCPAK